MKQFSRCVAIGLMVGCLFAPTFVFAQSGNANGNGNGGSSAGDGGSANDNGEEQVQLQAQIGPGDPLPINDAEFSSQSVPSAMFAGQTYQVSVTMTNNGTQSWSLGTTIQLGSQNAANNTTWGLNRVAVTNSAATGQNSTFTFNVMAPSTPGNYNFQWRMIKGTSNWFGWLTPNTVISVTNAPTNVTPTVQLTGPGHNSTSWAPSTVAIGAIASDPDGAITSVAFRSNGALLSTDYTFPYTHSFSGLAAGTYQLTAVATDNSGGTKTSLPISHTVMSGTAAAVSVTRTYVYDANERLCKTINPESGATLVDYDGAGNIAWTAEGTNLTTAVCNRESVPESQRTLRAYDSMNRLILVATPDGSADATYVYTADGLVESASVNSWGAVVTTTMGYNKRRMLTHETSSQPSWYQWWIHYGYNSNGHLASHTYPTGLVVSYSPNALGQPTQAGTFATNVSYFPNGGMSGFTYGNGVIHTLSQNGRQLPLRSRDIKPGSTAALDDTYAFDENGNVASIIDGVPGGAGNRSMQYDALDRLTSTSAPSLWWLSATTSYDALDNIRTNVVGSRSRKYLYNGNNQLANLLNADDSVAMTLVHDVRGNITSKGGGLDSFEFDAANRMTGVTNKEYYRYDPQGRRVLSWRPVTGQTDLGIYSQGGQRFYSQDSRGKTVATEYIYLNGSYIARRDRDWTTNAMTTKYLHTDSLGSPVAETDANGAITRIERYTPYGEPSDGGYDAGPGYTGHVTDSVSQLTYMQQRYYDPQIGRFLSVDPVGNDANTGSNFNRHWYANNNPYRFIDPDGRMSEGARERWGELVVKNPEAAKPFVPIAVVATAVMAAPAIAATAAAVGPTVGAAGGAVLSTVVSVDLAATQAARQVAGVAIAVIRHESKAALAQVANLGAKIKMAVYTSPLVSAAGRNLDKISDTIDGAGPTEAPPPPSQAGLTAGTIKHLVESNKDITPIHELD